MKRPRLITTRQAATILGVSPDSVRLLHNTGKLVGIRKTVMGTGARAPLLFLKSEVASYWLRARERDQARKSELVASISRGTRSYRPADTTGSICD